VIEGPPACEIFFYAVYAVIPPGAVKVFLLRFSLRDRSPLGQEECSAFPSDIFLFSFPFRSSLMPEFFSYTNSRSPLHRIFLVPPVWLWWIPPFLLQRQFRAAFFWVSQYKEAEAIFSQELPPPLPKRWRRTFSLFTPQQLFFSGLLVYPLSPPFCVKVKFHERLLREMDRAPFSPRTIPPSPSRISAPGGGTSFFFRPLPFLSRQRVLPPSLNKMMKKFLLPKQDGVPCSRCL